MRLVSGLANSSDISFVQTVAAWAFTLSATSGAAPSSAGSEDTGGQQTGVAADRPSPRYTSSPSWPTSTKTQAAHCSTATIVNDSPAATHVVLFDLNVRTLKPLQYGPDDTAILQGTQVLMV